MIDLFKEFWAWLQAPINHEEKKMKLSAISAGEVTAGRGALGFTVKSSVTGNALKVIGKSPGGSFIVLKMSGKNVGQERLIQDEDRYVLIDAVVSKKAQRAEAIKAELKKLGAESEVLDLKMGTLEEELETIEEAVG